MMRKFIMISVVLVFALSSVFMLASCAKKQISTGGAATAPETKAQKIAEKDVATIASGEAARQARLRALEKEQRLRSEMRVFESEHVYFDFDRSELKAGSRAALDKKAAWLRANSGYKVRIEGYCDERGTSEYNMALGERRANAAWKYLNALGVSGKRMYTISYGELLPADSGHNERAWAKNRRDEFKLVK